MHRAATQSHGGERDKTAIALHRCVLTVPFQLDAGGDSMRRISAGREGGRESGASEEDIKAAFIIHVGAGGGSPTPALPHPPPTSLHCFT